MTTTHRTAGYLRLSPILVGRFRTGARGVRFSLCVLGFPSRVAPFAVRVGHNSERDPKRWRALIRRRAAVDREFVGPLRSGELGQAGQMQATGGRTFRATAPTSSEDQPGEVR